MSHNSETLVQRLLVVVSVAICESENCEACSFPRLVTHSISDIYNLLLMLGCDIQNIITKINSKHPIEDQVAKKIVQGYNLTIFFAGFE